MAFFGDPIVQLDKPATGLRCTKDLVEEALFERRRFLLYAMHSSTPWRDAD
jgi:hypothetical protein